LSTQLRAYRFVDDDFAGVTGGPVCIPGTTVEAWPGHYVRAHSSLMFAAFKATASRRRRIVELSYMAEDLLGEHRSDRWDGARLQLARFDVIREVSPEECDEARAAYAERLNARLRTSRFPGGVKRPECCDGRTDCTLDDHRNHGAGAHHASNRPRRCACEEEGGAPTLALRPRDREPERERAPALKKGRHHGS
jgi:hypothetical protein